jgi:hypothetical protein
LTVVYLFAFDIQKDFSLLRRFFATFRCIVIFWFMEKKQHFLVITCFGSSFGKGWLFIGFSWYRNFIVVNLFNSALISSIVWALAAIKNVSLCYLTMKLIYQEYHLFQTNVFLDFPQRLIRCLIFSRNSINCSIDVNDDLLVFLKCWVYFIVGSRNKCITQGVQFSIKCLFILKMYVVPFSH